MVKELSSDPPSCLVTYMTRVDLKGKFGLLLQIIYKGYFHGSRECMLLRAEDRRKGVQWGGVGGLKTVGWKE